MLDLTPAEVGGWRSHFERYPPDGAERLLSRLCRLQGMVFKEDPGDEAMRPWAYTPQQAERLRREREAVVNSRKEEEADRRLTAFMMGG